MYPSFFLWLSSCCSYLAAFVKVFPLNTKLHTMDVPKRSSKQQTHLQSTPTIALLITLILLLSTIVSLYHPTTSNPLHFFNTFSPKNSSSTSGHPAEYSTAGATAATTKCDLSIGEWVPNPEGPYYTNTTCWAIHEHQNCMKYGRPDTDFMKWRWKPNACELPLFNSAQFLEILRNKSLAFVGDSVGRNHMQSLICLLSKVTYPEDVSYTANDNFKRWLYRDYNITVATFWSPFLVKSTEADPNGPTLTGLYNLYLDEFDKNWTTQIDEFDYVIISAGHWFFRPAIFYQDGKITGCFYCKLPNITELTQYHGYRMAFRTAFKAINSLAPKFKGTVFLRTFSPKHFENGTWNHGGNCIRARPFHSNETILSGSELEMYSTQVEEFKRAKEEGEKRGLNFMLLDTTQAMLLRPDGHPSIYGHWPQENVTLYYDCVHWCLPGPIDAWNDILLEMIKMDGAGRKVEVK